MTDDHDTASPFPIRTYLFGEPIPDLAAIPEDDWITALTPLSSEGRALATDVARSRVVDLEALGNLILTMPRRRRSGSSHATADTAAEMHRRSTPPLDGVRRRDRRQVSFRLTDEQYDELEAAGRELGLRPAPLARMLAQNGARRILHDARSGDGR